MSTSYFWGGLRPPPTPPLLFHPYSFSIGVYCNCFFDQLLLLGGAAPLQPFHQPFLVLHVLPPRCFNSYPSLRLLLVSNSFSLSTSYFWGGCGPNPPAVFNSYPLCVCFYFATASLCPRLSSGGACAPPNPAASLYHRQPGCSPPTPPLLFTIGSQDAEALGFQTQKVLPRSPALNAGGAAAKNTKPRGQDEAVRGQANMPRGQANRSGSSKQVQGSRKQGQGSKKQVAQAGEGCCQLGGPCARTRRFSCALVTTALV